MADNNDLKVVVGLDLPKSKIEVEKDLRLLEDILSRSDKGKLQIAAGLNTGKTIGIINQQIKVMNMLWAISLFYMTMVLV